MSDADLDALLVTPFPAQAAARRKKLLAAWRTQRDGLLSVGVPVLSSWLDGSFVSTKPHPGDIDVVTFVDGPAFDRLQPYARTLATVTFAGHATRDFLGIDSFVVFRFPPGHVRAKVYDKAASKWHRQWGHDRDDQPKGYLEVRQ